MKGELLLILALIVLAGCTTTSPTSYQNDVIVLQNAIVSRVNPFTDSTTSVRFDLQNAGTGAVPRVVVDFFDLKGLTPAGLNCENGMQVTDHSCQFNNIPSMDIRHFSITLKTPSADILKAQTDFTINYKISFDYSGSRRIIIPVIDDSKKSQPTNKYSISDPSVGPIALDIEPPVGAIQQQGDQQVKEYWGIKGDYFDVIMNFRQVVDTNVPTNVSGSNIHLQLHGLYVDSQSKCDFNSDLTSKIDITVGQTQTSLTCSFKSLAFTNAENTVGEKTTTVDASFSYTFEKIRSTTITVVPRNVGEGGSTSSNAPSSSGQSVGNPSGSNPGSGAV